MSVGVSETSNLCAHGFRPGGAQRALSLTPALNARVVPAREVKRGLLNPSPLAKRANPGQSA